MPYMPQADRTAKPNKQAQNYRAARKAGVKPGTRTIQADGSLGGGVKVPPRPTIPRPSAPPGSGAGVVTKPFNPGTGVDIGVGSNTPPYANLPNAPRPRNPALGGGNQIPPIVPPMGGTGREAGKADMVDTRMGGVMNQMSPYDGPMPSGGIYAGGGVGNPIASPPRLPPFSPPTLPLNTGGGSQGMDGSGPVSTTMEDNVNQLGGNPMADWLNQGNIPKRFNGNLQAAMQFMQGNPQSRMAQQFGQGQQLRPQGNPMNRMATPMFMGVNG